MFPNDVWRLILTYVNSHNTLCSMCMVCWQVNPLACEDDLWEEWCRRNLLTKEEYEQRKTEIAHGMSPWRNWKTTFAVKAQAKTMENVVSFIHTTLMSKGSRVDPKPLSRLINLDLSKACIGPDGAKILGVALVGNRTLERLDLSNQMMKEGFGRVVDALVTMPKFGSINLASNRLGLDGAQSVRRMLLSSTLRRIDLQNNFFGPSGAALIADGIKKKKPPFHLNMDYNQILDTGFQTLLLKAPYLSSLSVKDNSVTAASVSLASEFLKDAPGYFEYLDLSNTPGHHDKRSANKFKTTHRKTLKGSAASRAKKPVALLLGEPASKTEKSGCRCM
eukprot:TRINITY_DN5699_c0_g1_i1.p1 TRINITY_DN5699_c0_g1~~TRINITY_DN5699_c0_g1_i1.p1  ORF type:complete len:353 (+),score=57.79 TRINITY_DN5699_c0_g1_i1:60-1061(+)